MENSNYFIKYLSQLADKYNEESAMLNEFKNKGLIVGHKGSVVNNKSSAVNDKEAVEPETKAKSKAKTKAEPKSKGITKSTALNINWNILFYPGYESECQSAVMADPIKDTAMSLYDLLSKALYDEKENETNTGTAAKSESEIKNKNVNIVVHY